MKFRLSLFFVILVFFSVSGMFATMIIPSQDRTIRLMVVGGEAVILLLALSSLWRLRSFYGVWSLLLFLLTSSMTFIYTSERFGFVEHLNGLRETLFYLTSLIVVYDLYTSKEHERFVRWFAYFLVLFALAQTPVSIIQFFQYGAGDGVGGTYGTAGGSGFLVTQILFVTTFFFSVRFASLEDGSNFSVGKIPWILVPLLPCAINETKVSFVLLAVFILLIAGSRKRIFRTIPLLVLGSVLVYLLNYYYSQTVEDTSNILDLQFIEKYLLTNPTGVGGDMPRFQRLLIMFDMMGKDIGSFLLGMGYGLLGGGNIVGVSRLGRSLYYLMTGSRILLFRVWIQGGLVAVMVIGFTVFAWMRARAYQYPTLRKFHYFLLFNILVIWFYNEALLDRVVAPIVSFFSVYIMYGGEPASGANDEEADSEPMSSDDTA